ncbi:cell division protein FtsX [Pseudochryseolinea flava]|uniref:Cell division protein FtsX n=1 Tax=Pseudochryseolinea flava TaxID=2059302 RepID=A0A364XV13_9BACT|nr:permease-like cell division protein FtsX [Pseudochryseolinea flava]RAV98107.1 ABC transporter permease [Pseudochryseolinea flava]
MEKIIRKKRLGGYPALGVVFSIFLALVVLGMFGQMLIYSNGFERMVRDNVNVKVYLKSTLTESQRKQLEKTLASKNYIAKTDEAITFISREDAEKELIKEIGDYKQILGENPLKDAYIVKIDPIHQDTTQLKAIQTEIEKMNGVVEATYEKHLYDQVNKNFTKISIGLLILAGLLIGAIFLLVFNTLRLALFSQRFLIRSMQLVGARKWFIQRPFLFRAAGYGLLSGILAGVFLYSFFNFAERVLSELQTLNDRQNFYQLLVVLVIFGMIVAVGSTYLAIRRYLKMSLDQLY